MPKPRTVRFCCDQIVPAGFWETPGGYSSARVINTIPDSLQSNVTLGSSDKAEQRYRTRYLPVQLHYLQTVRPSQLAGVVIDNDDPSRPRMRVR